ncbi:hypothetical protein JMJ35_003374 [Cladonia borealis]|uniref:Elongator complex protein 1 n=1 Tax=Cladonia borealis TaxID=184061 RepID=A0AA39R4K3_9LECA|nr:hypothetical protein JMJ35_003374 [Cladonia borealis]
MRNLRNIHRSLVKSPPGLELTASAWDVASDSLICAFGPTKDNVLLELKRWKKYETTLQPIASWDAPCPLPDLECDRILDLKYFSDSLTACLVLAGGDLIIVREEPQQGEEKIEIVGSVDAGISAAAWSPDEELLAITTRANTLLYMTREFEGVTDITLTADDLKASNHVSVGWGKQETQFKGKKARALRDPTMPEKVDEGVLSPFDAKETTISWRGDGAYLAVNSIESETRRVIRVYSREGILDSVSEPVDNLVGALSWRPVGNLLAGIQYSHDRAKVVFFERNGLRHGQFELRLSKEELQDWGSVVSLKWNVDSSVLAVCFKDRIQLWTMGNYHYYLKQEIFTLSDEPSQGPAPLSWHPERPLNFTLSSEACIQRFAYASVISRGPTSPPDDYGIVAVIDGKCLKVTAMRLANVPPPMALHEIALENNAVDVAVSGCIRHEGSDAVMIAVLHREGHALYIWSLGSEAQNTPWLSSTQDLSIKDIFSGMMNLQIVCSREGSVVCLSNDSNMPAFWSLEHNGFGPIYVSERCKKIEGIVSPGSHSGPPIYLLAEQNETAGIEERALNGTTKSDEIDITLFRSSHSVVEATSWRSEAHVPTNDLSNGVNIPAAKDVVFSLSENGTLFANERRLVRSCTSFLVTPVLLIFTTSQHLLKFVHLVDDIDALEIPPDAPESDERCRSIERGARLVTVMPSIFVLVMQMPRGNLETIYPRALVLAGIRDSINKKKYKKAFLACRKQRVDMNILHDHLPQQFLSNVGLFIDQVQKVEHIDLFLSQLREEDVTKTMYRETLNNATEVSEQHQVESFEIKISKVNRICDAFLNALKDLTTSHFQNVVTAHVCKSPPDLDAGLTQIAGLRSKNPELVDGAIEHICFLADVNRLYDNALGLYDLELALLVAQQSQKDPKEYLPFLRNLQSMEPLRRQFSIDNHLGRFQKALRHLCNLHAFEEVKLYAVKHNLYAEALDFYRYQDDKLKEIMKLYADHLQSNGNFRDAGIAYEYLHDYTSASESYRQAHLWKESLSCANLIPLEASQFQSLAHSLADTLIESKDHFSAATIHLDYLSDIPTAARLFCNGYYFADALRIISLHNRTELLETVLDVGLVEGMASMTELLANCKTQLVKQVPRIRELRAKKAEDPLAFFNGDATEGTDIPDNVSLAPTNASTTGGSLFTRYTNRTGTVGTSATRKTSKNRRKEERKKARGKQGSVYEEEYLVNSVGRLIERINLVNEEVERLVVGLMRRGMRERARAVENAMVEVVELCKDCVGEVFADAEGKGGPEGRPKGGEGVLWDTLEEEKKREVPMVKGFKRLSLLGG